MGKTRKNNGGFACGFMKKDEIRGRARARRSGLDRAEIRRSSAAIQRAVMNFGEWAAARRVCLYLALPGEVKTRLLLNACWKAGKRVLVPAYRAGLRKYCLAGLRREDRVKAGRWSVPEPARPRWVSKAKTDLVVVPGLAFDRRGGRVGHGGGHYDRLLAGPALRGAFKIGIAFECQIIPRAPMDSRDIRMDAVVTERAIFRRRLGAVNLSERGNKP